MKDSVVAESAIVRCQAEGGKGEVQRQSSVVDKTREKCKKVEAGGSSHGGLYRLNLRDCPTRKSAVTGRPERFRAQIAPHCGHQKLSALYQLRAPPHKTLRGTRTQKQSGDCRPSVAYGLDRVAGRCDNLAWLSSTAELDASPSILSSTFHLDPPPPSSLAMAIPRQRRPAAGRRVTSALPKPLQSMEPLSQSLCPPAPNLVARPSALLIALPSTNKSPTHHKPSSSHPL